MGEEKCDGRGGDQMMLGDTWEDLHCGTLGRSYLGETASKNLRGELEGRKVTKVSEYLKIFFLFCK